MRFLRRACAAFALAAILGVASAHAQTGDGLVAIPRPGGAPGAAPLGAAPRRVVEAEGSGTTEAVARAAAVSAALEEVVGVHLESSRRSELTREGTDVRESFEERILAQSNGFVERVTTLRTWRNADGVRVRIRAEVVVNRLVAAMRDARMPLVPLDQESMSASLRTQVERDDGARQILADYLAALPANIETRLGELRTAILPEDPNTVVLTAPISFRVLPEYVERGRALFRDVGQDIQIETGRQNALALCDAPGGVAARGNALSCRGVGMSPELAARLTVADKDFVLAGSGLYRLSNPAAIVRVRPLVFRPGLVLRLHLVDAGGSEMGQGWTWMGTDCQRLPFASTAERLDTFVRSEWQVQRRYQPIVLGVLRPTAPARPEALPATCVSDGARVLAASQGTDILRDLIAVLPRELLARATSLRLSLGWKP